MLKAILPRNFDNTYGGRRVAIWLLGAVVAFKTAIALVTIFNGRIAAQTGDGIPLQQFGAAGGDAVVTLFAVWGVSQLALILFGVLALFRYRAMVPLIFLVLLAEHAARRCVLLLMPIAKSGTSPSVYVNFIVFPVLLLAGLGLSLWRGSQLQSRGAWTP
jgi:hypothetical protein